MEASDEQHQVYNLILLAEEQQKAAAAAVAAMAQEREELVNATEAMKKAAKLFPKTVGDATALGIHQAIGDAPKAAVGALNQARHALAEASHMVQDATSSIIFKITMIFAMSCALLLLVTYGLGSYILSTTLGDIEALRAQQAALQENVRSLESRGGKARLTTCGGRLCIEVSSNQGEGYENWHLSPWKTKGGAQMMILRGY